MSSVAIITSDYINGISIWSSLKKLKFQGEVLFLNTSGRNMVGSIWPDARVIPFVNRDPEDLLQVLKDCDHYDRKYVFLTSELFHGVLFENKANLEEKNVKFFFGDADPDLILDKEKFLNHLRIHTDVPVPESYQLESGIRFPAILKYRCSFSGDIRSPKPVVINTTEELNSYLDTHKVPVSDLQFQELLSSEDSDNISICGWYDEATHIFFQTRKIIQHPPKVGNGDVVEVMKLNPVLEEQAKKICAAIRYKGPFEIEFIKEREGARFKVIEMNPRFWMQHGLVEELSGHYLVARYLGIDPINSNNSYRYWIYPMVSIYKTLLLNFKYFPYFFKAKVYWPVNLASASKFLVKHLLSKI